MKNNTTLNTQKGSSLVIAMSLLLVFTIATMLMINTSGNDLKISISNRDSDAVLNLAETGLNLVTARFHSTNTTTSDIDGDGIPDPEESSISRSAPTIPFGIPYTYNIQGSTKAMTLLLVANGESLGKTGCSIGTSQNITDNGCNSDTNGIKMQNLFFTDINGNTIKPLLFTRSSEGVVKSNNTWSSETSREKVAVWLEYTDSTVIPGSLDLYAMAMAQIGKAKIYEQRFLGTFSNAGGTLGSNIAPITQSGM